MGLYRQPDGSLLDSEAQVAKLCKNLAAATARISELVAENKELSARPMAQETCQTCGAAQCPSQIESGECFYCIARKLKAELAASHEREKRLGEALEYQSEAWGLYGDESKAALAEWRAAK